MSTQQGIEQAEVGEAVQTKAPRFCLVDGIPDGSELKERGNGRATVGDGLHLLLNIKYANEISKQVNDEKYKFKLFESHYRRQTVNISERDVQKVTAFTSRFVQNWVHALLQGSGRRF